MTFYLFKSALKRPMMVLLERIELSTSPLPRECSTSELQQPVLPLERFLDPNSYLRKGNLDAIYCLL
jgi:hypothetical protein